MQAGCLHIKEQHQAETAPSSASGLKAMFGVFSRVTSVLCANGLLWDIQMPLWPLTLEGFLLHLWRKDFFFFFKQKKKKKNSNL